MATATAKSAKINIKPLGDKVIVEVLEAKEMSQGGIILPDSAQEKPQEAKVISVGSGKVLANGKVVAPDVKAGDTILFGKYAGSEIKIEEKEFLIIGQDDILAIIQ